MINGRRYGGVLLASAIVTVLHVVPLRSSAEWYVAGYGGISTGGSFGDVTMNNLGQRIAFEQFPNAQVPPRIPGGLDTLTQTFSASDVRLKSSPMFGGRIGYFFKDQGFSWLGLEIEAYTSEPSVKTQTVDTHQEITFIPNVSAGALCNTQVPPPANCPEVRRLNSRLSLSESSLRVTAVAFNLVVRYPGYVLQPYAGVGAGAFYFSGSGQIVGRQVVPGLNALVGLKLLATEEWGVFAEGKFNYANLTNFDQTFGLSGQYSIFHFVCGVAYHF